MAAELDGKVVAFVQHVCGAMGLQLDASLEETPDNVRVNLTGDGADALLKRKGEALDALQVVVNTAFRRDARGDVVGNAAELVSGVAPLGLLPTDVGV